MGRRLPPDRRREAIVDAALSVARRKGLGATTVREVASEMGTSSGLIHHYFASMDAVLGAAFARVAEADLRIAQDAVAGAADPTDAVARFFRTYAPADADWAFQLWLDAWSEAGRRPAIRDVSRRLNLAWQQLLRRAIEAGVAQGPFRCPDPDGAAWRLLSVVDGLALQVVAHGTTVNRDDVVRWAIEAGERELGLPHGAMARASMPGVASPTMAP